MHAWRNIEQDSDGYNKLTPSGLDKIKTVRLFLKKNLSDQWNVFAGKTVCDQ